MSPKTIVVLSLTFGGAFFVSGSTWADSLGCNGRIVSCDSRYEVRSVCGEPDEAVQRTELRAIRRRITVPCADPRAGVRCSAFVEEAIEVVIDEWTYDFGRNRFVQYVTFEQGKLVRVDAGSYGQK